MKYIMKKKTELEAWTVLELVKAAEGNWKELPGVVKKRYEEGKIIFRPDGMTIENKNSGPLKAKITQMVFYDTEVGLHPVEAENFLELYEPSSRCIEIKVAAGK